MKNLFLSIAMLLLCAVQAQLPNNVLVGYHENWRNLRLTDIHENYNVICLAFALPKNYPQVGFDIKYDLPPGYTKQTFMNDLDILRAQGKKIILSIGGATGPIYLNTNAQRDVFVSSINGILAEYNYKIDGIDLDLEGASFNFPNTWTINSPAAAQQRVIDGVKSIMANYQSATGKKMLLLMAPEVAYIQGGLSTWQVDNINGGAFLPILNGLRNELDLLCMQLYNAGGAGSGVFAWDGKLYYDDGTPDFALAMNETVIKGFTCVRNKGTFNGLTASKLAFGFPASNANTAAGTGYVSPQNVCNAARYFKGEISKPNNINYTVTQAYPELKGLMTWSINEDLRTNSGVWSFALNYPCAFPVVTGLAPITDFYANKRQACGNLQVNFTDVSLNNPTSWNWSFPGGTPNSSSAQNPSITYSNPGVYNVTLSASNAQGNNTINKQAYIKVLQSGAIEVQHYSTCNAQYPILLNAAASGENQSVLWYNNLNNPPVFTGNTYSLNSGNPNLFVAAASETLVLNTGMPYPINGAFHQGGFYLIFDALKAFTLKSVLIHANGAKNRTLELRNAQNTLITSKTVFIPDGINRINLDFDIPIGSDLSIGFAGNNADLMRSNQGVNYPYTIPEILNIKRSSATGEGLGFYY